MTNRITNQPSTAVIQQNSPLLVTPNDVIIKILQYLNTQDIKSCNLACKELRQIISEDVVWRNLFEKCFPDTDYKKITNFQDEFKRCYSNSAKGIYKTNKISDLNGSVTFDYITSADGKLYVLDSQYAIKIYDLNSNPLKYVEISAVGIPHTGSSLAVVDRRLFYMGVGSLEVWDLSTYLPEKIAYIEENGLASFAVGDNKIFGGLDNGKIKVWDLSTNPPRTTTFDADKERIQDLVFADGKLISGTRLHLSRLDPPENIKIWDIGTNPPECTATLSRQRIDQGHHSHPYFDASSLLIVDKKLISTIGHTVTIWDLTNNSFNELATFLTLDKQKPENHPYITASKMFLDKLVLSLSDGGIEIWDINMNPPVCTFASRKHFDEDIEFGTHRLAINSGKLFSVKNNSCIEVWNFTASHNSIFEDLAIFFETDDQETCKTFQAIPRFARMPKSLKNKIYAELYKIIKPRLTNDYWGCAEHAFHIEHGQFSTFLEKSQAIRNYQREQLKEDNHPLLQHLEIASSYDYSTKLGCRPEYLANIGIISAEDLEIICTLSPDIQVLVLEEDSGTEENFRDNKVKAKADKRKSALSDLSQQLSLAISSKIQETNSCGVLLYETECPWISFQNRLNAFRTKFDAIVLECKDLPKPTVEAFESGKYNALAKELNALVSEFQILDHDHQIAKLHTYINQWGILTAWTRRKGEGVQQSLKDLPESERTLQRLFQMGK